MSAGIPCSRIVGWIDGWMMDQQCNNNNSKYEQSPSSDMEENLGLLSIASVTVLCEFWLDALRKHAQISTSRNSLFDERDGSAQPSRQPRFHAFQLLLGAPEFCNSAHSKRHCNLGTAEHAVPIGLRCAMVGCWMFDWRVEERASANGLVVRDREKRPRACHCSRSVDYRYIVYQTQLQLE